IFCFTFVVRLGDLVMKLFRTLFILFVLMSSTSALAAPLICVSHYVSEPTFMTTHAIDIFVKNYDSNTRVRGSDIRSLTFANPYPKESSEVHVSFEPEGPACNGDWCDRIGDDEILVRSPQFSPNNTKGKHCFNVEIPRLGKLEVDFSARKRV